MKKLLGLALFLLLAFTMIGCKDKEEETKKSSFEFSGVYEDKTVIADGFTTLASEHDNGEITENGTYTVAGQTFTTKDTYNTTYTTEPTGSLFNYLTNTWTYNSTHYTNMVDGLVENDKYANIVGSLAAAYKVESNDDGTETWTFQLKEGIPWVKNDTGEVYAEVTAEDFVTGIKYVLDPINGSGTAGIVMNVVKGAKEYNAALADEAVDDLAFDTVGVEAVSKYQVAYTLKNSTPYFLSSLTYSPYLPVNADYLAEKGTDFGLSENDILVNGAFRISSRVAENHIEYTKNEAYWDLDHVYLDTVYRKFIPGTATSSTTREWYEAGDIDSFTVSAQDEVGYAQYVTGGEEGTGTIKNPADSNTNGILSVGDVTYIGYFNFVRDFYEYTNARAASTETQRAATHKALLNKDFRLGFLYGLDVLERLTYWNEDEPYQWLMRSYTNRELTSWQGKDYVDYVDEVYNTKQGTTGVSLSGIINEEDPIFDTAKSLAYFETAKDALMNDGLTAADFPIQIDVIGSRSVERLAFEETMYATLEAICPDIIDIVVNVPNSDDQNTTWGSVESNYDFSLWSGWGPDYADPQTFLHTMVIDGDMVDMMGFDDSTDEATALEAEVLGAYTALYDAGAAITDVAQTDARYKAFAEAEYALIYEEAIIIPWLTPSGYSPVVSKTVPYQAGRASYGLTSDKYKNVVVTDAAITQTQRDAVVTAYEAGK